MSNAKTIGAGGFGKCRVYYSDKYKRKVIEKAVGPNFIRTKEANRARLTTLIRNYALNEDLLKKEMVFMMLTKIEKLDCCVEILGYSSNPFKIIMEYCEGGDLRNILDKCQVPIQDKIVMISQILSAIKRMHEVGFIHGDLKCANIFLVNKYVRGDANNIRIKIGDFGLSEIGGNLVHGGTPGFMAPEVPKFGGSFESDIYSVGKVMLEIMTELPVHIIAAINIQSLNTIKHKLPKFLNVSEFYNLVIPCLKENPKERPKAGKIFEVFHGLMAYWIICEGMNNKMLLDYKIGDKVPVDCHVHPLTLCNDQMRQYNGGNWCCDVCKNTSGFFLSNTLSFHCLSCGYDLCQKCMTVHNYQYVNNSMLECVPKGKKVYVSRHDHSLILKSKDERNYDEDSWKCDICRVSFSSEIYSFHCKKCNYDVCLRCFEKNVVVKKKKACCIIY